MPIIGDVGPCGALHGNSNINSWDIDIQVNDRTFPPAGECKLTDTDVLVSEIMMHLIQSVMACDFLVTHRCVSYTSKLPQAVASVNFVSKESPTTVRDYIECLV
jgi:hypothetical protein